METNVPTEMSVEEYDFKSHEAICLLHELHLFFKQLREYVDCKFASCRSKIEVMREQLVALNDKVEGLVGVLDDLSLPGVPRLLISEAKASGSVSTNSMQTIVPTKKIEEENLTSGLGVMFARLMTDSTTHNRSFSDEISFNFKELWQHVNPQFAFLRREFVLVTDPLAVLIYKVEILQRVVDDLSLHGVPQSLLSKAKELGSVPADSMKIVPNEKNDEQKESNLGIISLLFKDLREHMDMEFASLTSEMEFKMIALNGKVEGLCMIVDYLQVL